MKEREAKRKREEDARLQRKADEEAEEVARMAQVKEHMKNKLFTYDSNGSIIWVQPVSASKLPSTNPAPTYNCKNDAVPQTRDSVSPRRSAAGKPPRGGQRKPKKREAEFPDSFEKFAAQQPSMMEAMALAPGVELTEGGRAKRGEEPDLRTKTPRQPMTR